MSPIPWRSGAVVALLAVFVGAAGERSSLAKPRAKHRCDRHLTQTPGNELNPAATRKLIVWGRVKRGATYGSLRDVTYYVCLRPAGSSLLLGENGPWSYYGADNTLTGFSAAGTYVVALASAGYASFNQCAKYQEPPCPPPVYWLEVADAKTRRSSHVMTGAVEAIVSPKGALAWLEVDGALWATPLHPSGRTFATSPRQLDTGPVDPHSLKFIGNTLYWTDGGASHQQLIQ